MIKTSRFQSFKILAWLRNFERLKIPAPQISIIQNFERLKIPASALAVCKSFRLLAPNRFCADHLVTHVADEDTMSAVRHAAERSAPVRIRLVVRKPALVDENEVVLREPHLEQLHELPLHRPADHDFLLTPRAACIAGEEVFEINEASLHSVRKVCRPGEDCVACQKNPP